jgi:hypothetical protein
MKPYPEPKPYYTLSVPSAVMDAARLVENYFKEQGVETWELFGVCSRNHAYRLYDIKKTLKEIAE